jgi:tripartite-type tricarboxylate transporter receptor subunit TctC
MKWLSGIAISAVVTLSILSASALAQTYPSKPIRVVIPWPSGGAIDILGRVVFQKITESLGQQFVIDNRGGAAGMIGADVVAKSPADGYTMMIHSAAHITNAHLHKKLPYDTLGDFMGVTTLATQVGILVVHPSLPVKSVKELVALAKARPDQIIYGSSGNGSFAHLAMALFNSTTGTKMVNVTYKGGPPASVAVASGETQTTILTTGAIITQINTKRVRPLAVTSDTRIKNLPDIPTLAEAGIPGYEFTGWVGVFVPAKTPRPIIDRLSAEIKKALDHPDVVKSLGNQTTEPLYMTPEQFAQRLASDYAKYGKLIKLTGAKIE